MAHKLKREFDVVRAGSIEEAQQALQSGEFDASLLDLGLPDGRGAELLPDLHDRTGKDIPLVVHSGYDADALSTARADAVIMKSHTSINDLVGALRRLVDNGRMGEGPWREVA